MPRFYIVSEQEIDLLSLAHSEPTSNNLLNCNMLEEEDEYLFELMHIEKLARRSSERGI